MFLLVITGVILTAGCQTGDKPRFRQGAYFGPIIGNQFPEPENLGEHRYKGLLEQNGFIYTCRGGFIDIGHLRESADRTAYISAIVLEKLDKGETDFSFKVIEPSKYYVSIEYPENWENDPNREKIAKDISVGLGQYFAHTTTVWHEILTWFGFKSTGVFSEYLSSFSWEDVYSDLLGTAIAARALSDHELEYDEAVTVFIDEELERLGAQPASIAKFAVETVEGKWYTGGLYFFANLKKRNFDIGLDDGFITPWLVPDICAGSVPEPYPVPNSDFLSEYGFSMEFEIKPRELEKAKIFGVLDRKENRKHVQPVVDFPVLMEY
ncbi:MAG: DUF4056 domain-containing protein, partial [Planctomycetota bacterium]